MAEDQRQGMRSFARLVNEVNGDILNRRLVVGERIDGVLVLAPVVTVEPVVYQLFEVREVCAVLPLGVSRNLPASASWPNARADR